MIKKLTYIAMALMSSIVSCETESNVDPNFESYFVKYYGTNGNQLGVDVVIIDNGFGILGTSMPNATESTLLLVVVDEFGNELSNQSFGGNSVEAKALTTDASGNFILVGTHTVSNSDKDVLIMRVSPDGGVLDSLIVGYPGTIEEANEVSITMEGDIIVIGSTTNVNTSKPGYNPSTDLEDIYSVRLDNNFTLYTEIDWRKITGFPGVEKGVDILQKNDGTFLFFGTTNRPPSSPQKEGLNMFLYPASDDGQPISSTQLQLFGTLADESAAQMIGTADSGFAMIGTSTNGSENDMYLTRVRSNNDFLSAVLLNSGRNVSATAIVESKNGGFYVLGKELINNSGDIYLAKTSISGALLWQQSFGGVDNDSSGEIMELSDGSIVFVGTIELESQTKVCLIKTNSQGKLTP